MCVKHKNVNKALDKVLKRQYNVLNTRKRGEKVSKKEENILKTISEALPKMSEFDKGYFLGVAESKAAEKKDTQTKEERR